MHRVIPLTTLIVIAGATCLHGSEIAFDTNKPLHTFDGFGINCWPGDESLERHCRELRIRLARLWIGGRGPLPQEDTVAAYRKWWDSPPGAEARRKTLLLFKEHGVRVIAGMGAPPAEWMEGNRKHLRTDRHGHFARLWAAAIQHIAGFGGEVAAIELYNEPDGTWSVHVTAQENASIVRETRRALDAAGFRNIAIAGPGTSHCDWGPGGDAYALALDAEAAAATGIWSNHAWEWHLDVVDLPAQRSYVRAHWPDVLNSFKHHDPRLEKPVYVTEAGTKAETFHGRPWRAFVNAANPGDSKCDAPPYAIRLVENAIDLANLGANAVIFWEATDQYWSKEKWGLLRAKEEGFSPRPAYEALMTFCPDLPACARVLALTTEDPTLRAAAFAGDDRIVVVAANGSEAPAAARVRIRGASGWHLTKAQQFIHGKRGDAPIAWDSATATAPISLPVDALVSCVLERKR